MGSIRIDSTTGPLTVDLVKDPSITFGGATGAITTLLGPKNNNFTRLPTSSWSNSSVTHTIIAPSKQTALSRRIYLKHRWQLTITGTPGTSGLRVTPGFSAPRAFPTWQACNQLTVQLNTQSVSINPARLLNILLQSGYTEQDAQMSSLAPSAIDNLQDYDDAWDTVLCPDLVGPSANILGGYGSRDNNSQIPRGAFDMTVVEGGPSTIVTFTTIEPVFCSPLDVNPKGLPLGQLQNIVINYQLNGNWNRLWSHNQFNLFANGVFPSDIQVSSATLLEAPEALVQFVTLPDTETIPKTLTYPYYPLQDMDTPDDVAPLPNELHTIVSKSYQLNAIPLRVLVGVELQDQYKNSFTSDVNALIETITLEWDNNPAINTNSTKEQNWIQNYGQGQVNHWINVSKTKGNIFIFTPGSNFPMNRMEDAAGVATTRSIKFIVTYRNINRHTYAVQPKYRLLIVFVNQGKFDLIDGEALITNTMLVPSDVVALMSTTPLSIGSETVASEIEKAGKGMSGSGLYGGSFSWGKFGKSALKYTGLDTAAKGVIQGSVNRAASIANAALGVPPPTGRGLPSWSMRGAGLADMKGGAAISRSELHKRSREQVDDDEEDVRNYE